MTDLDGIRALLCDVHRAVRDGVLEACAEGSLEASSRVASDGQGDTIYAIDRVGESSLIAGLEPAAERFGGIVLIAEGIAQGSVTLPRGADPASARWRILVDPIDGTRGLMYQKRSAWVLSAVAPNRGAETRLSDAVLAVQTEIPTLKQHLCDEAWATRGGGVVARRWNRLTGEHTPLALTPSRATTLEHGYATFCRFFPGAREELSSIDEEVMLALLGSPAGKARSFEDQYTSTGGQLYELASGRDRFVADLRPLIPRNPEQAVMACHPYDVCTALIAEEAGVVVTDPTGAPLDAPFDLDSDVAWVGYANAELRQAVEPVLRWALLRRGLIAEAG